MRSNWQEFDQSMQDSDSLPLNDEEGGREMRKFPCPYCKGSGGELDVILDDGTGPWYDCGVCNGDGMIVIGGPVHLRMKELQIDTLADTPEDQDKLNQ
jgi:hypothetical protein